MEQAGTERDGVRSRAGGRRRSWFLILLVGPALVGLVATAVVVARPWEEVPPQMRPAERPQDARSISVDFGIVTDPDTDWAAIDRRLDSVGASAVELNAGRVEFTAFDWPAHPDVAAEPGTDHLSRAARALQRSADGSQRHIGLIVDAFVPKWIATDPSVAGVDVNGQTARYQASATELAKGAVGDRLVAYVAALGERYDPSRIAITELFLSRYSFGDDDLALYRAMTGADDWPRDAEGRIDPQATELGTWRSEVIAGLLSRMRAALDDVRGGEGRQIELAMDVRANWDDPAAGSPPSGHDYRTLLEVADRLVVWIYPGRADRSAQDVTSLTAALEEGGYDMGRLTMSVGLWEGPAATDSPQQSVPPQVMAAMVAAASTHGVQEVNVTPLSYMSDAHWEALATVWPPRSDESGTPSGS
jgi:hypothetical protein